MPKAFHVMEHRGRNIELMSCCDSIEQARAEREKIRALPQIRAYRFGYYGGKLTIQVSDCRREDRARN